MLFWMNHHAAADDDHIGKSHLHPLRATNSLKQHRFTDNTLIFSCLYLQSSFNISVRLRSLCICCENQHINDRFSWISIKCSLKIQHSLISLSLSWHRLIDRVFCETHDEFPVSMQNGNDFIWRIAWYELNNIVCNFDGDSLKQWIFMYMYTHLQLLCRQRQRTVNWNKCIKLRRYFNSMLFRKLIVLDNFFRHRLEENALEKAIKCKWMHILNRTWSHFVLQMKLYTRKE